MRKIYNLKNVVEVNGTFFERLENHPLGMKYRFTNDLDGDDYDYVTVQNAIDYLDEVFRFHGKI